MRDNTNQFNSEVGNKTLEKILRLSYSLEMFRTTRAYAQIRYWENATGYVVLQDTWLEREADAQ